MNSSDINSFAVMNLFYFICFFCISTGNGLTKADRSKPEDVIISTNISSRTVQVSWKLPKGKHINSTYIQFRDSAKNLIDECHVYTPNISYTTTRNFYLNRKYITYLTFQYPDGYYTDYVTKEFTMSESKPGPVQNLYLEEETHNSVQISFKAGFNGGLKQSFSLQYTPNDGTKSNHISESIETDDTKPGVTIYHTIKGLKPSTLYNLTLISKNSRGKSSTSMYFNTTNEPIPGALIPLPVVVGGSVGIVLFLLVVFVMVIRRRKTNKANRGIHSTITEQDVAAREGNVANNASVSQEDKTSNGATADYNNSSPLPDIETSTTGNVPEYAVVSEQGQKTNIPIDGENITQDGSEYAAMDKMETTKGSFKGHQGESSEMRSQNKNAEGLLYIEVDFATKSTNATEKQLIITDENSRTDYIDIDFTKRADPLPESDTEHEVDKK